MRYKLFSLLTIISATCLAQTPVHLPAVSAVIETEHDFTLQDGTQTRQKSTHQYVRDSQGRTRVDLNDGKSVMIVDPVAGYAYSIDLERQQARKSAIANKRSATASNTAAAKSIQRTELGSKIIDGYQANGYEIKIPIPANPRFGIKDGMTQTTEVWEAPVLKLPILMKAVSPLSGTVVTKYTQTKLNPSVDASLFTPPASLEIKEDGPTTMTLESGKFVPPPSR
jgi:hypothetical protein